MLEGRSSTAAHVYRNSPFQIRNRRETLKRVLDHESHGLESTSVASHSQENWLTSHELGDDRGRLASINGG